MSGWLLGEPLDVHLVDDRVHRPAVQLGIAFPVVTLGVDHQRPGHERRRVGLARLGRIVRVLAEQRRVEVTAADDGAGVGVEEQLVRVAAQPAGRVERPGHPVAVGLSRLDVGDEAVPHPGVVVVEFVPGLVAVGVEEAHGHRLGDRRGDREVHPAVPDGRAEVRTVARPGLECERCRRSSLRSPGTSGRGSRSTVSGSAPWRRRIRSAISPVQPVWWHAPSPAPLSPWKYSLK